MVEVILGILSTATIAAVGFVVQINSRMSVIETRHEDIVTLINTRFDTTDYRLGRMEKAMNGFLTGHED